MVNLGKVNFRLNPKPYKVRRYNTGIESFDEWTGGLPYGLTNICGSAGSGKSLLSREIAKLSKHTLYFCCEVLTDAPEHSKWRNVDVIDYTRYAVSWKRALEELDLFITELKPTLVVIDSLTSFLSVTRKALPESDLREAIAKIHTKYEGKLPVIGINEVRGSGFSRSPAGGWGVAHGCTMMLDMEHIFVDFNTHVDTYGLELGDDLYTLLVTKDKHNMAKHKRARVVLDGNGAPKLILIKKGERERQKEVLKKALYEYI